MKSQMQNQEPHAEHHFADFFESLLIWGSIGWPLKCKLMGFFKHTLLSRAPPPCVVLCQGPEVNFPGHPRVTKLFCIGSPLNRSRSLTYCNVFILDQFQTFQHKGKIYVNDEYDQRHHLFLRWKIQKSLEGKQENSVTRTLDWGPTVSTRRRIKWCF